jgi:cellulose synthase/poly-beta-1,6-N-acetylglucosamine synthase-like glycosyltransferase
MGKAQALNFGLLFTRFDLVCTMDADTIPTSHGVEACLKAFKSDSKLVAAGGVIQVLSGHELKDNSPLKSRAQEWLELYWLYGAYFWCILYVKKRGDKKDWWI